MAVDRTAIARAFERAPGLVDRLASEAPFPTVDAAIARARAVLLAMSERDRIAVIDAHPRIGASRDALSADSAREQGDMDDAAVESELASLNDAYERTHGFRFLVFVAGRPRSEVVPVLRERLSRPREQELATAIDALLAVARDRLMRS